MQLSIIVPCYNEESVIQETALQLLSLFQGLADSGKISQESRIFFIDDGSKDKTWELVTALSEKYPSIICGMKLSRNFGHQAALIAGLTTVPGDAIISVDADLQDDLMAIPEMLDAHKGGSEIVYGVRRSREADSFTKRFFAESYYRMLRRLGVEVVFNHADYRLMGRRALTTLSTYSEVNVFLRGLIPQLGFTTSTVFYVRKRRFSGQSKYPLRKMMTLAWDGITSFSVVPLRFITSLGLLIAVGAFSISAWALFARLFGNSSVPGWASTVVPLYFLGGLQLFGTGLIGEYLAKIYMETKRRPRFIIEATT